MSEGHERASDSTNTYGVALIGGISSLLVWASIVGLAAYFVATGDSLQFERDVLGQDEERTALYDQQSTDLHPQKATVVDEKTGRVRVPIDYAMKKVVETLNANPTASVVPVVGDHNVASVPAIPGRPDDNVMVPAGDEGAGAAVSDDGASFGGRTKPADEKPSAGSDDEVKAIPGSGSDSAPPPAPASGAGQGANE